MHHKSGGPSPVGGIVTMLGGALVVISAFLEWGKVSDQVGGSVTVKGDTLILIAGIVLIVLGLGLVFLASRGARLALAIVTILAGLFALLITGVSVASDDVFASSAAEASGISEADVKAGIESGVFSVSRSAGLFISLAGSILVLIGGILALRRGPRTAAPAAPPAGYGTPQAYPPAQPYSPTGPPSGGPPPAAPTPPPAAPPASPPSGSPPSGGTPPPPSSPPPPQQGGFTG